MTTALVKRIKDENGRIYLGMNSYVGAILL